MPAPPTSPRRVPADDDPPRGWVGFIARNEDLLWWGWITLCLAGVLSDSPSVMLISLPTAAAIGLHVLGVRWPHWSRLERWRRLAGAWIAISWVASAAGSWSGHAIWIGWCVIYGFSLLVELIETVRAG